MFNFVCVFYFKSNRHWYLAILQYITYSSSTVYIRSTNSTSYYYIRTVLLADDFVDIMLHIFPFSYVYWQRQKLGLLWRAYVYTYKGEQIYTYVYKTIKPVWNARKNLSSKSHSLTVFQDNIYIRKMLSQGHKYV